MDFLINGLFGKEKWDFRVLLNVSSPRRTSVRLGEGLNLPLKIVATPRCREGLLRCRGPPRVDMLA